jgi:Caspase domain
MFRTLFAVIAAASLLGPQSARAESRLALVIGQSAYHSVPALPNPVRDARAIARVLTDAGFEVMSAFDLSEHRMRDTIGEFASRVAISGPNTVALLFYAGHGVQIDGENYLMPTDVDPKREADIPIQAIRLNDLLNALNSVPNKMRIVLLDACRNDPFPAINKTAGHGLALIDAKIGVPGTFVSFSTSPGAEAGDGDGDHSPYAAALLSSVKEEGTSIEDLFKQVRVMVNKATGGRQTPWDSSSLTENFEFVPSPGAGTGVAKQVVAKHTVSEWRRELQGKPVDAANKIIVADGTEESYEAFIGLYAQPPFSLQAREWLDRHRRMLAWNNAVIANTAQGFRAFLAHYPDSDLTATARKLEERLRNRPSTTQAIAAAVSGTPVASITPAGSGPALQLGATPAGAPKVAPSCLCSEPLQKKSGPLPKNRSEANRPRWARRATPPRPQNGSSNYSGSGSSYGAGYGRSGY